MFPRFLFLYILRCTWYYVHMFLNISKYDKNCNRREKRKITLLKIKNLGCLTVDFEEFESFQQPIN